MALNVSLSIWNERACAQQHPPRRGASVFAVTSNATMHHAKSYVAAVAPENLYRCTTYELPEFDNTLQHFAARYVHSMQCICMHVCVCMTNPACQARTRPEKDMEGRENDGVNHTGNPLL